VIYNRWALTPTRKTQARVTAGDLEFRSTSRNVMAKILVVDDDEQVRLLICMVLEGQGHEIETAANGASAIQMSRARRFDLVVTDIMMPQGDGLEVVMSIHRESPDTKLLAISGFGVQSGPWQIEYLTAASKLGNASTLKKPFTAAELEEAVSRLLR
jgi:CheY-like chemotaxis protein